jgi:hypothetical protein
MSESITRRCVIYFAGFDPNGSSHYHRKYKSQAAKQSAVSGYSLEASNRRKVGPNLSAWTVKLNALPTPVQDPTDAVHTDYLFAQWDDIVRAHWSRMGTAGEKWRWLKTFLATQWFYIQDGAVLRMLHLAWPPVVALVAPLLLFMAVLIAALATPVVSWWGFAAWGVTQAASFGQKVALTMATCLVISGLMLWLVRSLERKFHMLWLMRSYIFTYQQVHGLVPGLDVRLQEFGSVIRGAIDDGQYDEVLVVGHSSGAIMATAALAYAQSDALDRLPDPQAKPRTTAVSLVTLGQCIPMLSSVSSATGFRAQLRQIAQSNSITWVDFCAPSDGCCFAFVDATAPSAHASAAYSSQPKLLSPRLQTLFSAPDYQQLCRHRFDLHFQYIHAGKLRGDYDYFSITAGPLDLYSRYASAHSVTDYKKFRLFN